MQAVDARGAIRLLSVKRHRRRVAQGRVPMANVSSDTFDNVRGQAAQLFQSIVEQATSRAMEASHVASKKGQKASRFSRSHKQAPPSVRDIAFNAASGAIELWQAARDKAEST